MTDREKLLRYIVKYAYKSGDFTLSSGQKSNEFLDIGEALSYPEAADCVGRVVYPLVNSFCEAIGGPTMGADCIALCVSLESVGSPFEYRCFSVRKDKDEITPIIPMCSSVTVVDDVITSGGSIIRAIEILDKHYGLYVDQVIGLVDRQVDGMENIKNKYPYLSNIKCVYTMDEIREEAKCIQNMESVLK